MSKDNDKVTHLKLVADVEEESSEETEDLVVPVYEPNFADLRDIMRRVDSKEDLKQKFIQMYLSFEDLLDCKIEERGLTLFTEDDDNLYIYTVIKKDEIE